MVMSIYNENEQFPILLLCFQEIIPEPTRR